MSGLLMFEAHKASQGRLTAMAYAMRLAGALHRERFEDEHR
ncbi:hypothetical protein [Roseibium algae]|uniref:Uncharacterized protein n=1 Tax=Roseibium algae TaxID=3123038 RepID=A0ABU8TT59_9HYPH